jgi:hypothetical protein
VRGKEGREKGWGKGRGLGEGRINDPNIVCHMNKRYFKNLLLSNDARSYLENN